MTEASAAWPKIAVVGAGAVGGYFGGMLACAGAPVVMIGRPQFVEAVKKHGIGRTQLHDFMQESKQHVRMASPGFGRFRLAIVGSSPNA